MILKMLENENLEQYIWRLGQYKDSNVSNIGWDEIADIINKEIGNEDTPYSESAFRKPYQQAKRFYDAGVFSSDKDEQNDSFEKQKQELEKLRVKIRDERSELKRTIREEARKESYKEQLLRSISEFNCSPLLYDSERKDVAFGSSSDIVCTFFDVHTGINVDNHFNTFNEDVLRDRIKMYIDKIIEVGARHNSENVSIILSELVSGIIHLSLRIESNQNLIEQFLTVTSYISEMLVELSYNFNRVDVYVCPGNHSRCQAKKEDNMRGENMDLLAIPYLQAKLQNFKNVYFHENELDSSIAIFNVRGQKIFSTHGDRDSMNSVVNKLTMYVGEKPDIIYMGHRHTNAMTTSYDTKVLQAGCLSGGGDEFCMDKRLRNKAEQIISVITDDGLDCIYDFQFN